MIKGGTETTRQMEVRAGGLTSTDFLLGTYPSVMRIRLKRSHFKTVLVQGVMDERFTITSTESFPPDVGQKESQ